MSDKKKILPNEIPNIGFNLQSQETFVKDKGIILEHYAAIPSTIGQKDRGDIRRPDALDTISENGFLYKKIGEFSGIIVGNGKNHNHQEGGIIDHSTARLILPKYYNDGDCECSGKEISLLPGDRVYAKNIELKVPNYQKVEYKPSFEDFLQFPAKSVLLLTDSRNISYKEGVHFKVNSNGNIQWIDGKSNPGIDPETGRGRLYAIRYTYIAFWYVQQLLNEIRVTNNSDASEPSRMPYQAMIQREYVYHNRNKPSIENKQTETNRTVEKPVEIIEPNQYEIKVNVGDFEE